MVRTAGQVYVCIPVPKRVHDMRPKPYELIGFGETQGPKPYEFIGFVLLFFCEVRGSRASPAVPGVPTTQRRPGTAAFHFKNPN